MIYKVKQQNMGFSLIEIIVTLGVFAMLAATVSSTAGLGYLSEKQSGERVIGQSYAVEGIEAVKSIRQRGWSELTIGQYGLQKSSGYWEFNGTQDVIGDYTRQVTIIEVYRDGIGDIVDSGGSLDQHTKLVTVEVSWELAPSINNAISINNYFTNWQSQEWTQSNWFGGDGQNSWSDDTKFWTASESINIMNIGELRLSTVGTLPSSYALLMHLDGSRYVETGIIANNSFETFTGVDPDVDWDSWEETRFGSSAEAVDGRDGGSAAQISYSIPLAVGNLKQPSMPVIGNTAYQLSFYTKGDLSYFGFILEDEDGYYLRSDGAFSDTSNMVTVSLSEDWEQYNISFTTRGSAEYLYLTFNGSPLDFNQWFAVDDVSLSREVVYDESSYSNHGYKMPDDAGNPEYSRGRFSQSLEFSKSNNNYVEIASSDSLDVTSAITVEAWVYPTTMGGGEDKPIVTKWSETSGDYRSYQLNINPNKKLEFTVSADGLAGNGHSYTVVSNNQLLSDQWQQVVGVYTGTELKVYIEGQFENSYSYNQGIFSSDSNANVLIGSIDDNMQNDQHFEGKVDEVSIEIIALSDTEVYQHYTNSPLTPESVILWITPDYVGDFMTDKKVAGMHIDDNYLWVALLDKKRVESFDLSTSPVTPISLGTFTTSHRSEDVFTYGQYVYVMTDNKNFGVEIYQYTSTPTDAVLLNSISMSEVPSGLWIDNDLMFVSLETNEVLVYDLSLDPSNPTLLGDFATVQNTSDISVYGDYVYIALDDSDQALQTFDISIDPTNPTSTDIIGAIDELTAATTRDAYLFTLAKGSTKKVFVNDVGTDPSTPAPLGDFTISDIGKDIATRGSYLYIGLAGSTNGIEVYDLTFMIAGGSGDTNHETYGYLESSAFNASDFAGFNFISWSETLPSAEEDIRVQIKTAPTESGLMAAEWTGLTGVGSYYENGLESIIPVTSDHNGDQYIKYLIHLYGSGDDTPILGDITINYTP